LLPRLASRIALHKEWFYRRKDWCRKAWAFHW